MNFKKYLIGFGVLIGAIFSSKAKAAHVEPVNMSSDELNERINKVRKEVAKSFETSEVLELNLADYMKAPLDQWQNGWGNQWANWNDWNDWNNWNNWAKWSDWRNFGNWGNQWGNY